MNKQLTLTTAMAAALIALPACSSNPNDDWDDTVVADRDVAVCVDQNGTRVDDDRCNDDRRPGLSSGLMWYYIGRSSAVPYYGDSVRDRRFASGSYQPRPGAFYTSAPESSRMTRSRAVSRGGLGSTGRRFGGGRS